MTREADGYAYRQLAPGDVVGGVYTIDAHLGEGGWATVYRAHRRADPTDPVALKTIRPELAADSDYRRLFRAEQTRIQRIHHTNVCPVHDWSRSDDDDPQWLVMHYVVGETLMDRVRATSGLKRDVACGLLGQAADGLAAVHRAGIVHRDFHPKNLIVGADGHAFVIDFGLAKRVEQSLSATPWLRMSSPWSAPEAREGLPLTFASDVYSLGMVLAYAITGIEPYDEQAFRDAVRSLPAVLANVVIDATVADPRARMQTAEELSAALRDAVASGHRPGPRPFPSRRQLRTMNFGLAAVSVAGIGLAIGHATSSAGSEHVAAGVARLERDSSWTDAQPLAASIGPLRLSDGVTIRSADDSGRLVVGRLPEPANSAASVPAAARRALSLQASSHAVRVGTGEALAYEGLAGRERVELLAAPTSAGWLLMACIAPRATFAHLILRCRSLLATLRLVGARAQPVTPSAGYAREVASALAPALHERQQVHWQLAGRSRGIRAAAAASIAVEYTNVGQTLALIEPNLRDRGAHRQLRASAMALATAFDRVAQAARADDAARDRRAVDAVAAADRSYERAIATLRQLGYRS
jgi:hypothetical protein